MCLFLQNTLFSQNSRPSADSLLTLGTNLFKQRQFAKSIEALQTAKELALKAPHLDSVRYASVLHYLGSDYSQLGDSQQAIPLLKEALALRRKVLGPDHPDCGKTLNNLAGAFKDIGKYKEAEGLAVEALQLKEKKPGKETLEYSNSQTTLVSILQIAGQYERADSLADDLVQRRSRVGGTRSLVYANALNVQAGIKTLRYDLEAAERSYLAAFVIMKEVKGANSYAYLSVLLNLGQLYAKMGQYDRAETEQRAALELSGRLTGKNSTEYVLALNNLAFVIQSQGRLQEALPILTEAKEKTEKIHGPDAPETRRVVGNQASALYYMGEYAAAALLFERNVGLLEKSERRDQEYYNVLTNYGTVLTKLGNFEKPEYYLLKAETDYAAVFPSKLSSLHLNLGVLYLAWGKLDAAEQRLLRAMEIVTARKFGFSANDVSIFFILAEVFQKQNNYGKALHYAQAGQGYLEQRMTEAVNYFSEAELQEVTAFFFSRNNSLFETTVFWNKPELNAVCYDNLLFTKGFVVENAVKIRRAFEQQGQAAPQIWSKWNQLSRSMAAETSKPSPNLHLADSLRRAANSTEKKLIKGLPADHHPIHWQQVQAALQPGETAVEFVRYENAQREGFYAAAVLTKNAAAPFVIPICREQQFIALLGEDTFPFAKYYGKRANLSLFELVLRPLMPHLKATKKVFFAPAGLLCRLNFSAIATYTVVFQSVFGKDTAYQEVPFVVTPSFPPEQTAFGLTPVVPIPADEDDGYVILTEVKGANESFNHLKRDVYGISIAGKALVFDKQLANKLNTFCVNPRKDVKEITLYAEKIVIRCALKFPQTNVIIHARTLVFEDANGETASINTQPEAPTASQGNVNGLMAGSIAMHIKEMSGDFAFRFRLIGGAGQGTGNGGNGGVLSSNLDLSAFLDAPSGMAGSTGNKGTSGGFQSISKNYSWLHPYALRLVIAHTKIAYLNGHFGYTRKVADDYVQQISEYQASAEWGLIWKKTKPNSAS